MRVFTEHHAYIYASIFVPNSDSEKYHTTYSPILAYAMQPLLLHASWYVPILFYTPPPLKNVYDLTLYLRAELPRGIGTWQ